MPKKGRTSLKLIKEFLVKCRLEMYTGGTEAPEIITYHTFIIPAVDQHEAREEAAKRTYERLPADVFGKVVIESCTKGV